MYSGDIETQKGKKYTAYHIIYFGRLVSEKSRAFYDGIVDSLLKQDVTPIGGLFFFQALLNTR